MRIDLSHKELGIVESVLVDFNKRRLPRLLNMKARVDNGETLNEYDITFLSESFEQSRTSPQFAQAHPEFKILVAQVAELYHHITSRALKNETDNTPRKD